MKRIVSVASTVLVFSILFSFAGAVQADDNTKALEKAMWQAWAKGDLAVFEQRFADDHIHVSAGGILAGKAANLEDMKKHPCEVRSWKLGDIKAQPLGSDAVLLVYTADQDATCRGEKAPSRVHATAVWKKTDGKWLNSLYHETGVSE
ncbi:MAG TPA: nuclear transport factor 2 family protein [Thermoanaerobaculia bacterium]|nr:nuclear transport factor 2 family protein [Thermoanaerobaculia bacterium]